MQSKDLAATAAAPSGGQDDVIDRIVGLAPHDPLYAVRHARQKVSAATQASYDLFFSPDTGLPLSERLLVAWYACVLSRSEVLAAHYRSRLDGKEVDGTILAAVEGDSLDGLPSSPLKAMLTFTRKLILKPVEGDEAALKQLQAAGVGTPDVVTLAQLIAFLSYQIRVVAGLSAMKALEKA